MSVPSYLMHYQIICKSAYVTLCDLVWHMWPYAKFHTSLCIKTAGRCKLWYSGYICIQWRWCMGPPKWIWSQLSVRIIIQMAQVTHNSLQLLLEHRPIYPISISMLQMLKFSIISCICRPLDVSSMVGIRGRGANRLNSLWSCKNFDHDDSELPYMADLIVHMGQKPYALCDMRFFA